MAHDQPMVMSMESIIVLKICVATRARVLERIDKLGTQAQYLNHFKYSMIIMMPNMLRVFSDSWRVRDGRTIALKSRYSKLGPMYLPGDVLRAVLRERTVGQLVCVS